MISIGLVLVKKANYDQYESLADEILNLLKNEWSESLAVRRFYFTHYLSYFNLEEEGSTFKIGKIMGNLYQIPFRCGGLIFWARNLSVLKIRYLLQMFKWY